MDPSKMKVAELKAELIKRGDDGSGLKADLVMRLVFLLRSELAALSATSAVAPAAGVDAIPATETKAAKSTPKKPETIAKSSDASSQKSEPTAKKTESTPKKSEPTPKKAEPTPKKTEPTPKKPATPAKKETPAKKATPKGDDDSDSSSSPLVPPEPTLPPTLLARKPVAPEATKKFHFEFGGPVGAVGVMVGLPLVTFGLFFSCGLVVTGLSISNPFLNRDFEREHAVIFYSWLMY